MLTKSVVFVGMILLLCSVTLGMTLDFDGIPSGTMLHMSNYAYSHKVFFTSDFRATDHAGWSWGLPHSPANVLTSVGRPSPNTDPLIGFGYYVTGGSDPDCVLSVAAFFSTQTDAMVRVTAYRRGVYDYEPVDSKVVGAIGESWDNTRVVLSTTPDLPFELIRFQGVNSDNDLLGFCLDDMTITLVPEPSSLLALAGGLMGLGALGLLRRRVTSEQ